MDNIFSVVSSHPAIVLLTLNCIHLTIFAFWLYKFGPVLNLKMGGAILISVISIAVAMVSLKLWAILEVGGDLARAANYRLFGGLFIVPLFYFCLAKTKKWDMKLTMDIAAIFTSSGLLLGRLGCLIGGCCKGMYMFESTDLRWPIRELELIFYVIFIVLYAKKITKRKTYGQVYPVLLLSYGLFRFAAEWLRVEYTGSIGFIHLAHIWSLISVFIGSAFYFELKNRNREQNKRRIRK